jgi:hypothetical protein
MNAQRTITRMGRLARSVAAIAALIITACATPIPPAVIASADYGPPPPLNYEELIKARFARVLIDPTSPIYEFGTPSRGYTKASPLFNTQQTFGWRVCGSVNSKNRFGGYVGSVPYFVLFRDGQVAEMLIGEITDNEYGINLRNSAIVEACQRTVG